MQQVQPWGDPRVLCTTSGRDATIHTSMPRLRLLLAWLLMAALPLQGMAAASMLFCGSGAAGRIAQTESHPDHHAPGNAASEHGSHAHGAHAQSDSTGHAGAGMDHAAADEGFTQGHSCPICAACSQSQAVGGFDPLPLASPAPPPGRCSGCPITDCP